jgi:hypothetical protein
MNDIKLVSKSMVIDQESYQPHMRIVLDIPMTISNDRVIDSDFYESLGRSLVEAMKDE